MDKKLLFEKLQRWNSLFEQLPLPEAQSEFAKRIRDGVNELWDSNMLLNAAELGSATELQGTIAEEKLKKAIALAEMRDNSKLDEIHSLLVEVQEHMLQIQCA